MKQLKDEVQKKQNNLNEITNNTGVYDMRFVPRERICLDLKVYVLKKMSYSHAQQILIRIRIRSSILGLGLFYIEHLSLGPHLLFI